MTKTEKLPVSGILTGQWGQMQWELGQRELHRGTKAHGWDPFCQQVCWEQCGWSELKDSRRKLKNIKSELNKEEPRVLKVRKASRSSVERRPIRELQAFQCGESNERRPAQWVCCPCQLGPQITQGLTNHAVEAGTEDTTEGRKDYICIFGETILAAV